MTLTDIDLGIVPRPALFCPPGPAADRCHPARPVPMPVRYRPVVPDSPITQAVALQVAGSPVTPGDRAPAHQQRRHADGREGPDFADRASDEPAARGPIFFGVIANQNTGDPAKFDLSVVYNPPGGAPGLAAPPVLEKLTDLSLNSADPNFVVDPGKCAFEIHQRAGRLRPEPVPAGFPTAPAMLSSFGTTDLKDTGGNDVL